ncbi:MAG: hypothetical protein D6719_10705 [Candidatus Dadabacteria bacterium]|nr:MAG: hypothetical protein D6719_10705 [Candidatus Dadabacteria bacterium]
MTVINYGDSWQLATVLVGGIATLAIFSFLIKENPVYRIFEHLFIGIAAGFGIVFSIQRFLWPNIMVPLLGLDIDVYPDGTLSHSYNYWLLLYILPMVFGLLFYFLYSKRFGWLAKVVIGFQLGASGGLAFKGFFNEMIPQLEKSFKPLVVFSNGEVNYWQSFEHILFVFTLLSVMYYFFFSFKRESRLAQGFAGSGRWLMMICFGAFFGSTVMARMALLVERLQFLIDDWSPALKYLFGA